MDSGRSTRIDELRLGDDAVRSDGEVVVGSKYLRGPPVGIDDASLQAAIKDYPVAGVIGFGEVQNQAGEEITERALQSQAEPDRDYPRCRQQAGYRRIKNVVNDGEYCADVDKPRAEVLQKPGFHGLPFEDEGRADEPGEQPRSREPPDDFEHADRDVGGGLSITGVDLNGVTPATTSMMVRPANEVSWQRNRPIGRSRNATRVTRKAPAKNNGS
jgi:hypothetical protein